MFPNIRTLAYRAQEKLQARQGRMLKPLDFPLSILVIPNEISKRAPNEAFKRAPNEALARQVRMSLFLKNTLLAQLAQPSLSEASRKYATSNY